MLSVARRIGSELPVTVRTTFLGAHALPPEFAGQADDYIDEVCGLMLPALVSEGLVDAVDAFCETIGFSAGQTERVFRAAQSLGVPSSCMPNSCPTRAAPRWCALRRALGRSSGVVVGRGHRGHAARGLGGRAVAWRVLLPA